MCPRAANLPAVEVISEFIISETKHQLIYTDNAIYEIAFRLNFNDSPHFVKYFKRFTNYPPKTFRIKQG
ncbi:helix-turn-helix domain-containing protein [Pedobacter hiemivivus]|uniref:Helix-turn-helix domain-containing protein n=1 Tax=Pedobacter hiemivivus TaxID=2530454 RepID=A0A4R0N9G3_9SPHI|nr:helix-turn-helix domain-containing protein [Pedobacter hiemivivus]